MRVHEIINEGVWDKALGLGARLLSKSPKAAAIERLASQWASEISRVGKATSKASTIIGKDLAKDKALLSAAKAQAEKLAASAARAKNAAVIKGAVGSGLKKAASAINKLAVAGIAVDPIYEYNKRMGKWEELLKSGKITQEQYDEIRQKEMATMMAHMTANIGGLAVFKSFAAGSKFLLGWIPGVSAALTGLSTAGAAAMAYWWQTDEGRKWITYAIMNEFYDLSPILGGVPLKAIDELKAKIPGFNSEKTPAATGGAGGQAAAQPGTTAPTAAAPKATGTPGQQPAALAGTNLQTVDTGPGTFDVTWKK